MKTLTGSRIEITDAIDSNLQSCIVKGTTAGLSSVSMAACGKNLFDCTKTKGANYGNCVTLTNNGFVMKKSGDFRFAKAVPISISKGTTFTVSANISKNDVGSISYVEFYFFDAAKVLHYSGIAISQGYRTVTAEADYSSITFYIDSSWPDNLELTIANPQLELGKSRTAYDKFHGSTYSATPTATLMAGDTYDLVSGTETHLGGATYQHTSQQIRTYYAYTQIINNAGADITVVTPVMDDLVASLPAWRTPKTDWDINGKINISVWQRIDDNIWRIADFYGMTLPYKTWQYTSWPTASEVVRIESNINALLEQTHVFQSKFDWNLLNDIETQLLALHAHVVELQLSVRRAGTIRAGQNLYIPIGGVT